MKSVRLTIIFLLVGLFIVSVNATAWPAESWVADPATGCKIGWSNSNFTLRTASWSGPVVDGKAEGKGTLTVTIRGKDGKDLQGRGEVEMVAGLLDGKGTLKWSDGHSYDGYYKAGKRNGKGVMKWPDGQIYDGEWKDDEQLAAPLKVDKILGIPWGASEKEAKRIMLQRPKTSFFKTENDAVEKWQMYPGSYNDHPVDKTFLWVRFYQGKMYAVEVKLWVSEDQVMAKFNSVKQGMSQRYGAPISEKGKYLDSVIGWDLGGGYFAYIAIQNTNNTYQPFDIFISYYHNETSNIVNKAKAQSNTSSKDY